MIAHLREFSLLDSALQPGRAPALHPALSPWRSRSPVPDLLEYQAGTEILSRPAATRASGFTPLMPRPAQTMDFCSLVWSAK